MPAKKPVDPLAKNMKSLKASIDKSYLLFPFWKRMWIAFCTGAASAVGAIIALAIILPFAISILKQFEWIPWFGDILAQLLEQMEKAKVT